jgi:hypothetical protein
MTPKLAPLKAGDTFSYAGTCKLPAGNWTATCQVRGSEEPFDLVGTVVVSLGTVVGLDTPIALFASAAQTQAWPVGTHALDIRYAEVGGPDAVIHTSTILVPVQRSITVPV